MIDNQIPRFQVRSRAPRCWENLASSSKFGFSVLGVTVTSRLLAKAAATASACRGGRSDAFRQT